MTWRFGGWRPILPGNRNFYPDEGSFSSSLSSSSASSSSSGQAASSPGSASKESTLNRISTKPKHMETEQVKMEDFSSYVTMKLPTSSESDNNFQQLYDTNSMMSQINDFGPSYQLANGPEVTLPIPPHSPTISINRVKGPYTVEAKPVKEAEIHAYEVIRRLKERGRDIEKDYGTLSIPDDISVGYGKGIGLLGSASISKSKADGKRYVTVPVAVETDHDKVLTQNDIKDIEKEVLKIIPEVEHSLVDGAVKEGAKVLEFGTDLDTKSMSVHVKSGPPSVPLVIAGPSPMIYESSPASASKPIKSRISSIFRPLLAKFRPPTRMPPAYSQSDPRNLNIIHLIAHQEQLPAIVPVERLARRPEVGKSEASKAQISGSVGYHHALPKPQFHMISHQPYKQPYSSLQKIEYKIIHPPQLPANQQQSLYQQSQSHSQKPQQEQQNLHQYQHASKSSYNEYQTGPIGPPIKQDDRIHEQRPNSESPGYQVIELPKGYQVSTEHLLEAPPQIVSMNGEKMHPQLHQYNQGLGDNKMPGVSYANDQLQAGPAPPQSNYQVGGSLESNSEPPSGAFYSTTGNSVTYDSHSAMDIGYHQPGEQEASDKEANNAYDQKENNANYSPQIQDPVTEIYSGNIKSSSESNENGYSGQVQGPSQAEQQQVGGYNSQPQTSSENYSEQGKDLMPSIQYAEQPKIELLDGAMPNFEGTQIEKSPEDNGGQLPSGQIDTKTLIDLITDQLPQLQSVLGGSDYSGNQERGQHEVSSAAPQVVHSDSQYMGGQNSHAEQRPKFGDRIKDDPIYAKAEQYDDRMYQGHDPSSQGLYLESSDQQEVRVNRNQTLRLVWE